MNSIRHRSGLADVGRIYSDQEIGSVTSALALAAFGLILYRWSLPHRTRTGREKSKRHQHLGTGIRKKALTPVYFSHVWFRLSI